MAKERPVLRPSTSIASLPSSGRRVRFLGVSFCCFQHLTMELGFKPRKAYRVMGLIPLVWACCFFWALGLGSLELGHLPRAGIDVEPDKLGLWIPHLVGFVFLLLAIPSAAAFVVSSLLGLVYQKLSVEKDGLFFFLPLMGIASYFVVEHFLPEQLTWFFQ